jgi:hypothetical protein
MVGAAIAALAASGQLNNTYIVFSSDNGYHLGQFNLAGGKQTPNEEDVHLPLYIRGPGVAPGSTIPHLVANIDIAVTIADLAGIDVRNTTAIPTPVDGRSFKDVLLSGGASSPPDAFRQGFLIGEGYHRRRLLSHPHALCALHGGQRIRGSVDQLAVLPAGRLPLRRLRVWRGGRERHRRRQQRGGQQHGHGRRDALPGAADGDDVSVAGRALQHVRQRQLAGVGSRGC